MSLQLKGPGQPWVIIWTNLIMLENRMLSMKFQSHPPFSSGEDLKTDLLHRAWQLYWSGYQEHLNNFFVPPKPCRLHTEFRSNQSIGFKRIFWKLSIGFEGNVWNYSNNVYYQGFILFYIKFHTFSTELGVGEGAPFSLSRKLNDKRKHKRKIFLTVSKSFHVNFKIALFLKY